jgi:hypothetical protein
VPCNVCVAALLQMTMAEASEIADTALKSAVRCILQAVQVWASQCGGSLLGAISSCHVDPPQAQEILRYSRGGLTWHGQDLRHFKRILSPPLQQLLTQPGMAVLGRGLASMPVQAVAEMGASQVG